MMQVKTEIQPDEISFGGGHVLFVEGNDESIDISVLSSILPITVKALGPSHSIKSVAQAFAKVHPRYYFLIDRDHYEDHLVEDYWKKFPNADIPNLLIWKKKEIENYFLDSAYLCQASYLDKSKSEVDIQKIIIRQATRFLYMSVVNQVIISIREDFKKNWVKIFRDQDDFPDEATALKIILSMLEFSNFSSTVSQKIAQEEIKTRFNKYLSLMTGDERRLVWNKGQWQNMIPGKNILHNVLGSTLFTVLDREGNKLTGVEKETEIIKDLLSPKKNLPDDFIKLIKILKERDAGSVQR